MHISGPFLSHRCLLLVAVLTLPGCGQNDPIQPVSGIVTVSGKPAENLYVYFSPEPTEGEINAGPASVGFTDEHGRFTLRTNVGAYRSGARVGKHSVSIYGVESLGDFTFWTPPPRPPGAPPPDDLLPKPSVLLERDDQPMSFLVPPNGTSEANFEL